MKKTKVLTLILMPVILAGCEDPQLHRDVYASREACLKDWNEADLCKDIPEKDQAAVRSSGGYAHPVYYYGPQYYGGTRSVEYLGRVHRPAANFSAGRAMNVGSSSISSIKSSPGVPSRGGFGSTARGMSSAGG